MKYDEWLELRSRNATRAREVAFRGEVEYPPHMAEALEEARKPSPWEQMQSRRFPRPAPPKANAALEALILDAAQDGRFPTEMEVRAAREADRWKATAYREALASIDGDRKEDADRAKALAARAAEREDRRARGLPGAPARDGFERWQQERDDAARAAAEADVERRAAVIREQLPPEPVDVDQQRRDALRAAARPSVTVPTAPWPPPPGGSAA